MFVRLFQQPRRTRAERKARPPQLEILEDRTVPAIGGQFNVSATQTQSDSNPSVAIVANQTSGTDQVVAAWVQSNGNGDTDVRPARFSDNTASPPASSAGTFNSAFDVANTGDNEDQVAVAAAGSNGNFVVVWRQVLSGGRQIVNYALYAHDGTEIVRGAVNNTTYDANNAQVAMDYNGRFVITYVVPNAPTTLKSGVANTDIVVAQVFSDQGVSLQTIVVGNGAKKGIDVNREHIAMNDKGRFSITFHQSLTGQPSVKESLWLKRYSLNKFKFGSIPVAHYQGATQIARTPKNGADLSSNVSIDARGNSYVVYDLQTFVKKTGTNVQTIFAKSVSSIGGRGRGLLLEAGGVNFGAVDIAVTPNSKANKTDKTSGTFFITFQSGAKAFVQEFSTKGVPVANFGGAFALATNSSRASISVDSLDNYFVGYQIPANFNDVVGRIGITDPLP